MQILLSAFACEPGRGSEQEVGWKWAVELARSGKLERVVVLTQTRNRAGIESWLARPEYGGLPLEFEYVQFPKRIYQLKSRFDFLTMPYYAAWQGLALRRARELHRERPFDLVHHLTFATFRIPIWMKRLGIPVIMGPVGGAEKAPWQLLRHRARPGAYLREAFRNAMTGAGELVQRAFPPLEHGRGLCLAATPRMQAVFSSLGQPVELFPTVGVDLDADASPPRPTSRPASRFLYVGRLHFLKGLQLLLDAFRGVEGGATLSLVGDGPEQEPLMAQAAALGIADRVFFLGRVPREELKEIYRGHDVLCAPSLYESGGLAVLEAMEHGLPAIVLDVGGHAVSVTPDCGVKIPADGPPGEVVAALERAMARYMEDGALLAEHGRAARRRVEREYAWNGKIIRMLDMYRRVMEGNPSHDKSRHVIA